LLLELADYRRVKTRFAWNRKGYILAKST